MKVLTLGSDVLRESAADVTTINGDTAQLVSTMVATMQEHQGLGLAAPQVGVLQRLFVCQVGGGKPLVFVNPRLVATSPELVDYEEGCLSIPGVYAELRRPGAVQVEAWNEKGRQFTVEVDGILARVIQHEIDHLHGILFIDRLSVARRKRIIEAYEKKTGA